MDKRDFRKLGFISEEHYLSAIKTLKSDFSGEFTPAGKLGCHFLNRSLNTSKTIINQSVKVENYGVPTSVGNYPEFADLTKDINPKIFDQGTRGTCAAQSTAALVGYYFGNNEIFSAEYIYALLKMYDHDKFAKEYNEFFDKKPDSELGFIEEENIEKMALFSDGGDHINNSSQYVERLTNSWNQFLYESRNADPNLAVDTAWSSFMAHAKNADPINNEGAFLTDVCQLFATQGFCDHDTWPYSGQKISGNEGHLPVPSYATQVAKNYKIKDKFHLLSSPGNIDEIKKILSGNNGKWRPMPVLIGVSCFSSWLCSPFTKKTGWINFPLCDQTNLHIYAYLVSHQTWVAEQQEQGMPLEVIRQEILNFLQTEDGKKWVDDNSDEIKSFEDDYIQHPGTWESDHGGHAMLVVGYYDEPMIAGGGYFLVRNSWGKEWAWFSDHVGHAKIPYAYIHLFCLSALTIIQPLNAEERQKISESNSVALPKDTALEYSKNPRDEKLKLVPRVIEDIISPANDYDFSDEITLDYEDNDIITENNTQVVIDKKEDNKPNISENIPSKNEEQTSIEAININPIISIKNAFINGVDANLQLNDQKFCLPSINLPLKYKLLPWQIKMKKVVEKFDLTEKWMTKLIEKNMLSTKFQEVFLKSNSLKLYELNFGDVSVLVISAFITPIENNKVVDIKSEHLEALQELLSASVVNAKTHYCDNVAFSCVTIGTTAVMSKDLKNSFQGNADTFFIYNQSDFKNWSMDLPHGISGEIWFSFVEHLLPENSEMLVKRLKKSLEKMFNNPVKEGWNTENLFNNSNMDKIIFKRTLARLLNDKRYKCKNGEFSKNEVSAIYEIANIRTGFFGLISYLFTCIYKEVIVFGLPALAVYIFIDPKYLDKFTIWNTLGCVLFITLGTIILAHIPRRIIRK